MQARLVTMCELWPGITPWNVYDLRYGDWLGFSQTTDNVIEERRKAAQTNG